jgi:hypothetical protein
LIFSSIKSKVILKKNLNIVLLLQEKSKV